MERRLPRTLATGSAGSCVGCVPKAIGGAGTAGGGALFMVGPAGTGRGSGIGGGGALCIVGAYAAGFASCGVGAVAGALGMGAVIGASVPLRSTSCVGGSLDTGMPVTGLEP